MVKDAVFAFTERDFAMSSVRHTVFSDVLIKCPTCKEILYRRDWEKNFKVCKHCGHHFKLTAHERISLLVDAGSFSETNADIISADPLAFSSLTQSYASKACEERRKTGLNECVITGHASIGTKPLSLAIMDFTFIGGSMSSAVGEKITLAIESGIEQRIPVLIAATSGGARMQEGIYSLMQMAKTTSALAKLKEARLPFFSLLTDPTTGGVTASFATLGDVILAEPGALVCFAGPRVIEGFMHTSLPEGTARAEFAFQHGMIDAVVPRRDLRETLIRLLRFF